MTQNTRIVSLLTQKILENIFRSFFNVVSLTPKFFFIFGGWRTSFELRKTSKNISQNFLVRKEI
jgi:hypothetical protein